ncbi:hypothetical protein Pan258_35150 [Symmachiella dynata]|uniref:helix-turn-helix domain-containing protein n=1 Tax=Symmachiella dynata TaxID=2527995 RepID=UPI001189F4C6|nr:helix-turn-helix domain-containing protein [Symmachiella dynata]QDT49466.1 hypothetical protein Pan258_35150 [Symmachiella dynata]
MKIEFPLDEIRAAVRATLEEIQSDEARLPDGRLAYPEGEAAKLLGIAKYVLRDARLRGEIVGCRVGAKICYERAELMAYLQRQREGGR